MGADARLPRGLVIAAMLVVAAALVVARRPDAVTRPQFYAEDGTYWFADAYNLGLRALLQSNAGYLQTLPRLVAIPASHLGLVDAALLFNLVAIAIQAAPAAFVLSRRFDDLGPLPARAALGLAYILIPSAEINATITNAQWHLAILAALVVAARPPRTAAGRAFDGAVVLLCGLTGPFCLLLLPGALLLARWSKQRRGWLAWLSAVLAGTLVLQAIVFVQAHRGTGAPLGASLRDLVFIAADRVVLAASFAEEAHSRAHTEGRPLGLLAAVLVVAVAAGVVVVALRRSPAPLRVFLLVCFGVTAASLVSPLVPPGGPAAWALFAQTAGGERYFFTAEVAWLVCLAVAVAAIPHRSARRAAAVIASIAFLSGLPLGWRYPAYPDKSLARYDAILRAAAPGSTVVIPIDPNWTMTLTRH